MAGFIYLLSAATCLLCAILLLRTYRQRRVRLLLWSGLCFLGLMLENAMLYLDVVWRSAENYRGSSPSRCCYSA
jgi:hypothetical protein